MLVFLIILTHTTPNQNNNCPSISCTGSGAVRVHCNDADTCALLPFAMSCPHITRYHKTICHTQTISLGICSWLGTFHWHNNAWKVHLTM